MASDTIVRERQSYGTGQSHSVAFTSGATQRFLALDALRGFAALFVVFYHVRETTPIRWLAPHGYLAVDFFFALSGFVIAHAYRAALETGALSAGQFLLRRYIRLWPAAALGTLLGVFAVLAGQVPMEFSSIPRFVALGALLIPAVGTGGEFFPLNPPHWSLFDEIAANAVYGLGLYRVRVRALLALTIVAGIGTVWLLLVTDGAQFAGAQRVVYPYLAGTLAYEIRASGVRCQRPWLAWSLATATLLGLWLPEAWRVREAMTFAALTIVVFPLTVWACADLEVPKAFRSFCHIAGETSYPLYAIHYPLLLVAWNVGASASATVVVIGLIALATGRFFDAPLRRWLMRRLARSNHRDGR